MSKPASADFRDAVEPDRLGPGRLAMAVHPGSVAVHSGRALPASFLTGASAAAGIAAINSLGNLSGFASPYAMGYLKDLTGSFTAGLFLLAGCSVVGVVVAISLRIDARREQIAGQTALAH
jgi:nitrate/nitrite transporter NarK